MDELKQVDPLLLAIYQAAADHQNVDFEDTRALPKFFGGQKHLLPALDVQQIESIVKAVCAVVGPVCAAIDGSPG